MVRSDFILDSDNILRTMYQKNFEEVNLFNIPIAKLGMLDTLLAVEDAIDSNQQLNHCVVNVGEIVAMQSNDQLRKSVLASDLINADGMAVVWASHMLGMSLPERVARVDLMENLVELSHENGYKCFFLGAKLEVVEEVVQRYIHKYGASVVAGYHHGYFGRKDDEKIAQMISDSGAHILLVAMTSPLKEAFLKAHKHYLRRVNMIMDVGGSFDVVAGKENRAPMWVENFGLEWCYPFFQEPKKMWKRYLVDNSKFILLTFKMMF